MNVFNCLPRNSSKVNSNVISARFEFFIQPVLHLAKQLIGSLHFVFSQLEKNLRRGGGG